jgi:hypothetical protein
MFNVVQNPVTGKGMVYVEKRPGWGVDSLVSTGLAATGLIKPQLFNAAVSAFGETNSAVYVGTNNVGNATGRVLHMTETVISGSSHVVMKSSDGTGWYYADGAKDTTSYTGFTSSGAFVVSTIANTAGFFTGQLVTGNTIGAAARVSSVNAATSTIGLTVANTANSTGAILTKEPIGKIIDSNFVASSTYQSAFVPMDGYLFYCTDDGKVRNSDLNTDTVYSSNSNIAAQMSPDPPVAVAIQNNTVVVLGLNSKEVFSNAGLSSGSPLQRVTQAFQKIGCVDQRSLTSIEDDIYFVATPYEGDIGVYRLRNLNAVRVSTPEMDRILGTIASGGAIYAHSFRLGGYPYAGFVVTLAQDGPASIVLLESGDNIALESAITDFMLIEDAAAQTASFIRHLVYNTTINIWGEWDDQQSTFIDGVGSGTGNSLLAASRVLTTGKVYTINPLSQGELYQDDSSTYSMQIRTSKINHGTDDRKYVSAVRLICDTQSAGAVLFEKSDDDFKTWQTLGTFDMTKTAAQITRCGAYFGGRAYRLTHSSNTMFRASELEIDYTVGTA